MNLICNFKRIFLLTLLLQLQQHCLIASPFFLPTSAPLFTLDQLNIAFEDSLEPLFGALAPQGKWRNFQVKEPPSMETTLSISSLTKDAKVEITRIFSGFGKSCRGPKLKIRLLPQKNYDEIRSTLGTDSFFLVYPCFNGTRLSIRL